jgi:5'-nucleotidase
MERRTFLTSLGALGMVPALAGRAPAAEPAGRITLLHTNDTHSRIEPFGPGNGNLSGKGGMARRAALVKQLRRELGPVLLLDAGDVFQGTPYFNRYKGLLDYRLMSMAGYDAGTLGNHDFDNGVEGLLAAMVEAKFPFVNCNLDMKGAPALAKRVEPYIIREFPGVRVGITGACVAFKGLVTPKNSEGVVWQDPIESLRRVVKQLRPKVDVLVLLSHLGHDTKGSQVDDLTVARLVPEIDVIIGGHSHTFLEEPVRVPNSRGETLIFQVGFGGVNLGRLDLTVVKGQVRAANGLAMPVMG